MTFEDILDQNEKAIAAYRAAKSKRLTSQQDAAEAGSVFRAKSDAVISAIKTENTAALAVQEASAMLATYAPPTIPTDLST